MANWYVRESGGTTSQCTGHADVNYDGSGTGEACAYATVQDAINGATFGDTIHVEAGKTFITGGNLLTNKGVGTDYIRITSNSTIPAFLDSYPDSYINGVYTRVTTAMAATMPKIVTHGAGTGLAAFRLENDAHHWWIDGLEITNDVTATQTALIGDSSTGHHHFKMTHNWIHPQEEDGTDDNIQFRSVNHAIIFNGDYFTFTNNAITGVTGHSLGPGAYRLEASCILSVVMTNTLIENNLLEVNGQLFIGGGGGVDAAHTANATGTWTLTSGTLDSTTDLEVGHMIAIHNTTYANNHLQPNSQSAPSNYGPVSAYQNGRILTINHGTGAITFTPLTSGLNYRQFPLYRFGATGGSYTLTWMGQTTAPIAWNGRKYEIRAALEALSNVAPGDFQVRLQGTDKAWGAIQVVSQPNNNDTLVIGLKTYTFKTSASAIDDIQIGGSTSITATNIASKLNNQLTYGAFHFVNQPNNGEIIFVDSMHYTFKNSPTLATDIQIGVNIAATATNLATQINIDSTATKCTAIATGADVDLTSTAGGPGGMATLSSDPSGNATGNITHTAFVFTPHAVGVATSNVVDLTAYFGGSWGNSITFTVDGTRLTKTAFYGGADTNGWPYSDYLISFNKDENNNPGNWSYPEPVNPLTITSSLTGGGAAGYVSAYAAESYSPTEVSQDGTTWDDIPTAGMTVAWNGTQAHDVIVRRNIIAKRHIWTSTTGDVKGFVEQKGCSPGCKYDANIFTGRTTGFVFTVRNQGGATPWASNSYTEFTNNIWDEGGGALDIANTDGSYELQDPSHDILVHNNLIVGPGGYFNEFKRLLLVTGGYNITFTHNTMFSNFWLLQGVGYIPITSNLTLKDNIFRWQNYSAVCTDTPGCWNDYEVSNNVLFNQKGANSGGWFSDYGAGSAWEEPDNSAPIFNALSDTLDGDGDSKLTIGDGSDYTVAVGSPYKAGGSRDASDGTDVGVNFPALITAFGYDPFTGVPSSNPEVNAGSDQSLGAGTTSTTLTATADDPNDEILTYLWTRTSGPNTPTIVSATSLSTSITGMIAGTYVFKMTATNESMLTGEDSVQVVIAASGGGNVTVSNSRFFVKVL